MGWIGGGSVFGISGGSVSVPTLPTVPVPATAVATVYSPNLVAGPTGKCPYRPWIGASLDGFQYFVNGYDQPWRVDYAANESYDIGAAAPTGFSVADATTGTTFPSATVLVYYLCWYNSTTGKQSCPQLASGVPGTTHTMSATKDVDITWTDPGGEWSHARIFRRLQDTDGFKLVATVTASTETYTDSDADSALELAPGYTGAQRLELPPIFHDIEAHQGKLWGIVPGSANLYHAQPVLVNNESRHEDFPPSWVIPIEPQDGAGGNVAIRAYETRLYIFKRRAVYELQGDSLATFFERNVFKDRGCLSKRTIVSVENYMILLDERGILLWVPGGEPAVAGAGVGSKESPFEPIWRRMNLDAAHLFWARHNEEIGCYELFVALDHDPVPLHRIRYDYRKNRLMSLDSMVQGMAGGYLNDTAGRQHLCHVCDLGYLWEDGSGTSDGYFAAGPTGTVTGATDNGIDCSGAAFDTTLDGAAGCPFERYDSDLDTVDTNRAVSGTGTRIVPLYGSSSTVTVGDSIALGAYLSVLETADSPKGTETKKRISRIYLEHREETTGALDVSVSINGGTWVRKSPAAGVDLSAGVRALVPVNVRCYRDRARLSMSLPGHDFAVTALSWDFAPAGGNPR